MGKESITPDPQTSPASEASAAHSATQRLIDRARQTNLIHGLLHTTLETDDLYRVIASTLVSRRAMGFSQALLFHARPGLNRFKGVAALGAADRATHNRIQQEIAAEEERLLGSRAGKLGGSGGVQTQAEEQMFAGEAEDLSEISSWSAVLKHYEESYPLTEKIAGLRLKEGPAPRQGWEKPEDLVAEVFHAGESLLVTKKKLDAAPVPAELKALIDADSLWAGIESANGSRLLLIVDKRFEDTPIGDIDRLHVNWFCGQMALALANAELFGDLKRSHDSLRELDTLKGNFLSTISHELRTPLTAITGFARLLVSEKVGKLEPQQKQMLERVLINADRLIGIVNDLIEISEIDSGSAVAPMREAVDPLDVLMRVLPKLEPRRISKGVAIEPVVRDAVPHILSDLKGLERIFYHLIDNAIKFSKAGDRVRVEFNPHGDELEIRIVDQGIGIPQEQLQSIFDAFYQVDSKLTRVHEGMGIGLTLTRKLVQGTGGKLTVESEPGKGSAFAVTDPTAGGG